MLQASMRKRHERLSGCEGGFTLVELLVVIVILGVLAGVVVVAVGGISNKSTKSACQADVASVQTAEETNFAQKNTYDTIANLIVNKYLRSAPTNSGYVVSADAVTGAVTSAPACSTL